MHRLPAASLRPLSLAIALALFTPLSHAAEQYHLAPGPLSTQLNQFAAQAGIFLVGAGSLTEGHQSRALEGSYSVEQALVILLEGSGLEAVKTGEKRYELKARVSSEGLELGATTINSNQLGTITEGSGSYTPGTIATATRLVLTPKETPQSVSVITRQELDDFNLTSIDEVMQHTPGVSIITYDSERTEYYSRGFVINEFQYDGIPMSRNSRYSAGNTLSDMAIYDRVEVLKGATGLLTGSGQPGATLNLIRKKPTHDLQGHISLGTGSWDNYRTEIDLGGPLTETGSIRGRAVAAYQDTHSFQNHYQKKTQVYYGTLEVDLSDDTLLTLGADYQYNDPKGSSWGGIRLFDNEGNFNKMSRSFNPGAQWGHWDQYTRSLFSTLEHRFANDWVGKLQLNYQINGYDAELGAPNAYMTYPDPVDGSGVTLSGWLGKYVGEVTSRAADGYFSGPVELFGRQHDLVFGASISKQALEGKNYWPTAGYDTSVPNYYTWNGNIAVPNWYLARLVHETTRQNGFYTTGRFSIQDDLTLILGARLSNYDYRYTYNAPGTAATPSTKKETGVVTPYSGLVYDLNDNLSVYGSYTSIFNPQTYQDTTGNTLDPLEGNSYETGIKADFFEGRLNSSLAWFQIEQDNYAEATSGRTPTGATAYRATQGVVTKGFEVELSGQLTSDWQVHAGYTHKVARRDGNKVTTIEPEDQFSFFTTHRLSGYLEPVTVGGGARWQAKAWDTVNHPLRGEDTFTTDAYWLVDLMARYQINRNLSATVNINNVLDKKYFTLMSVYDVYSYGEPRNITASLKWDL